MPKSSEFRPSGAMVFNAIVALVRNRTGLDYHTAFNKVLANNADLMRESLDGTNHTGPLHRLLNRMESATGLSPVASTELAVDKIADLSSQFFPALSNATTSLQWDVLSRAALQLEHYGIPRRLYNRASGSDVSRADWNAANLRAGDVLTFLEDYEKKSDDFGNLPDFKNAGAGQKWRTFKNQIDRLVNDEGLTVADAFTKLKETQPIFWTHALLSFKPEE
jgi:hypothetical protein